MRLAGFAFAFQRADLNDPSGVDCDRLDGRRSAEGLRLRLRLGTGRGDRHRPSPARGRRPVRSMPATRRVCRFRCRGWPAAAAISVLVTSGLITSGLATSGLPVSALATTALDVSGTSTRAGAIALVTGVAGWGGPAEASFIGPALIWTVFTLTGLHRFGRTGNCGDRLRLDHAIGQRLRLGLWLAAGAPRLRRPRSRKAVTVLRPNAPAALRPARVRRRRPERRPGAESSASAANRRRLPQHRHWRRPGCAR